MIAPKEVATFILQIAFCITVLVMIARSRSGKRIPQIRKVAGLEALDEAIGRATELGRPVHYTMGVGDFKDAQTLASFSILGYVARICARYETRIIVTNVNPVVYSATEEIVHQAFVAEGHPDKFISEDIRYVSNDQFAYASGVLGILVRERVATNILMGRFMAEALIFSEAGSNAGAIQIAGTTMTAQLPFFVASCDYTLIGEEFYAASAYLSRDPVLLGNLVGQDFGKIFATLLIIALTITVSMGSNWLMNLLKK